MQRDATIVRKSLIAAALVAAIVMMGSTTVWAGGDWNDKGVQWRGYEEGLAEAKKNGKPVCLIFYTDWCPHCTRYSGVFHDDKVIAKSKELVMIRLNKDENKELSGKYAPDGQYIPRTFFLLPDGAVNNAIKAPREKYQYFYNPQAADEVLAAMNAATKGN